MATLRCQHAARQSHAHREIPSGHVSLRTRSSRGVQTLGSGGSGPGEMKSPWASLQNRRTDPHPGRASTVPGSQACGEEQVK